MARRKSSRKTTRGRARRVASGRLRWVLLPLLSILALAALAYVAWLDYTVRTAFEGKRWAVPARVYARPLEIFEGMPLNIAQFEAELGVLKYRDDGRGVTPGAYARRGDTFYIGTRGFTFWDGREVPRNLSIDFGAGRVSRIALGDTGKSPGLLRLDPALIGGIHPAHNEDRVLVQIKDVPPQLVQALLAVEDRAFFKHHGVSPRGILRAIIANLRAGGTVQGGSTLTQQLVKNFYLSNERTLSRKLNEAIMALLLDWHYDKNEILEAYLNEVYLGQDGARAIHGFGLASEFYFERPIGELKLQHMALLVALVKGPSYYDPRRHPDRALARRNLVLDTLVEEGAIDIQAARAAQATKLDVAPGSPSGVTPYPAYIDLVRRHLRREYREEDLTSEGLRIFTTLDPLVQASAERAVSGKLVELERSRGMAKNTLEGAMIVTAVESGEVLAVVGGREPRFTGFNRALDAVRQIGSLAKPAVYLAALMDPAHYTLATPIDDTPFRFKNHDGSYWAPMNYDRQYHDSVLLENALAHSYNVATARLGMAVGLPQVIRTMQALGVERDLKAYPSLLLGAQSLTPLEVAQMYQTLAAGGFRTPLRAIREVLDADGKPLTRYPLTVNQAIDPAPVFLLNTAMQEVVRTGTGRALNSMLSPDLAIAGKTGTTDDLRDSWFAGYTGDKLAVAWVGRDDNKPAGFSGGAGALRVWGDMMSRVNPRPFQPVKPAAVEYAWIDPYSGLLTDGRCGSDIQLPFIAGSAPVDYAPCYRESPRNPVDNALDWFKEIFR
jgi:penicillin-binding protein 1B